MIYITKHTDVLRIPRITAGKADRLVLINQTTKQRTEKLFEDIDCGVYMIDIQLIIPALDPGQYDYYVLSGAKTLATGIVQVSDYATEKKSFDTDYNIKQFEPLN